jgi:hypothetical protein
MKNRLFAITFEIMNQNYKNVVKTWVFMVKEFNGRNFMKLLLLSKWEQHNNNNDVCFEHILEAGGWKLQIEVYNMAKA